MSSTKSHFPVITFGLDLFSGAYLDKLLLLRYLVIENNSNYRVNQVRCFLD